MFRQLGIAMIDKVSAAHVVVRLTQSVTNFHMQPSHMLSLGSSMGVDIVSWCRHDVMQTWMFTSWKHYAYMSASVQPHF